ncbi:hypothetical protein SDRG_01669 [Saprolegnia diclina VS20]|uniref:PDZ domain-containing protein n=1 Tax=Saprolegnia diclina (strain VS20) TaxID=1156394 RepID=T0SFH0_SAPDV|nr:hypothetical protein SDRG_01669 [Saprolegnia diclina VS20]EQC41712.1 hypothetical protein SDRG_01669 [Saprolegnia diclina VS20]|eukprot:XP_008605426.1 hypothetical protein SDRG_01669 [Saprolegnia diclina VS20]
MSTSYSASSKLSAIELAQAGDWKALEMKIEMDPDHAMETDLQGNLPLHWACCDPAIPLVVLEKLVYAYPDALWVRSHEKHLPLELALADDHTLPDSHVEFLQIYSPMPESEPTDDLIASMYPYNTMSQENIQRAFLGRSTSFVGEHAIADDFSDNLPELMSKLQRLLGSMEAHSHIYSELNSGRLCFQQFPSETEASDDFDNVDLRGSGCDYYVIWKRGELGIRLKQSTTQAKTGGCRIERITQGKGVATGIMMARLGDLLVSVNNETVEKSPFSRIVQLIQQAPKPVQLGFRTPTKLDDDVKRLEADRRTSSEWTRASTLGMPPSSLSSGFEPVSNDRSLDEWSETQASVHNEALMLLTDTLARCELLRDEVAAQQDERH